MALLQEIRQKASRSLKTVVLPESDDSRTLEAVDHILDHGIARVMLVGPESIRSKLKARDMKNLRIIDPLTHPDTPAYAAEYYEMRKAKGMTEEEANRAMREEYVLFGAMCVRKGLGVGFVGGASHTTPEILRAALRCMQIDKKIGVVSGAFLMELPDTRYGENGVFVYADCGVNPDPNSRQLAGIAVSSAALFEKLVGKVPRVAFLSYSSKGSASGEKVDKIVEALNRAREVAPHILMDGEFQLDSAIEPEVARYKCPQSVVAGKANVLIFPDLNSGNICYKMTQRLANARAVGPLLQGFTMPCSDLSRGCIWEDIVDAAAITSVRA